MTSNYWEDWSWSLRHHEGKRPTQSSLDHVEILEWNLEQRKWCADMGDHYNVSNDTVWPFADIRSIFYIRLTIIFHYCQVCVQSPHTIVQRWGKLFNIVMFAENISACHKNYEGMLLKLELARHSLNWDSLSGNCYKLFCNLFSSH